MYRAPEMIDQYQGFNVQGQATDVWMLGCVLYVLCTGNKHPFQDAANLAILNAQYEMDELETNNLGTLSEALKDLIRAMLVTNPAERLTLAQLKDYLLRMNSGENVDITLCREAQEAKAKQKARNEKQRQKVVSAPTHQRSCDKIDSVKTNWG